MDKNRMKRRLTSVLMGVFLVAALFLPVTGCYAAYGDRLLYTGTVGDDVRELQRDLTGLGYNTYGIDGIFGPKTLNAVLSFQKANGLKVDGIVGPNTKAKLTELVSQKGVTHTVVSGDTLWLLAKRYGTTVAAIKQANGLTSDIIYVGQKLAIPGSGGQPTTSGGNNPSTNPGNSNPPSTPSEQPSRGSRYGQLIDWSQVNNIFKVGMVATVTDLDTGTTWQVKRMGGSNHADCEPLTAADAAKMKATWGGQWSWARRAIIVSVAGQRIAASQHAMPHGSKTIADNNFPGHFCIHFLNSMTHGGNQWAPSPAHVDSAHQAAVRRAAGM
ncbi:MAG: LysM peptidoglycan-binding domain-containing protein [Syntrophomonadaceae bacterium]|nr:LysM peptidoglycan-binding domain-containing protein [Syntrophomonadaceae bacterium]